MSRRSAGPGAVLAVVSFGVFIAADDLTVVTTMLRHIIGDLQIPLPDDFDRAAWIVNSYLVAYVAVMPFMGRLSDVLGRRRVFVGALALFLAGSLWIPFTTELGPFVAGRVMTALGGGAMVPVALAAIGDVYGEGRRARPLGVLGAVDTIGWVWGPLFGALLVRFLDWRWQFYLNVPLAIAGIALAWWALRGLDRPTEHHRIDWGGAIALSAGLAALNIALLAVGDISTAEELADLTGERGFASTPFFVVAAAALVAFVILEWRSRDPLVDLRLFSHRDVAPAMAVNFLVGAVLVVAMVDVPLFVNLVVETNLERAAVMSGWVLSTLTATMAASSWAGGVLTARLGRRIVVISGVAVVAGGFVLMGSMWDAATGPWEMGLHLAVLGTGFGLVTAPVHDAAVAAAPPDRRGTAGGLVILARLMGLAVGLSGLTAWALHRFEVLRSSLDLPSVGSPDYSEALEAAQGELTATALGETFLFAAAVAAAAVAVATALRRGSDPAR
jgi:EmrB/QacA subfamily drug resistance transporter